MASFKRVYIDPLTGAYNRAFLDEKTAELLQNARDEGKVLSVVMFDIDYFKRINDLYGHAVGDQVLKEFAKFLKNSLRAGDILIRYGGDEFLAILSNVGYSDAFKIVERILENCKKQEFAKLRITVSAGISSFPKHADNWESLFELVDKSLYFAKRNGRDRVGVLQNVGRVIIPTYDIVGRINEIEKIINFVEGSKKAKVLHIIGEIGVGKTRLVKEVLNHPQLKSFDKFESLLSPSTKSIVFYPVRQLVKYLAQKNDSILKELPPSLLSEIYKLNPPENSELGELFYVDKFRLFEALKELLKVYTQKVSPLIIFIDDAHWIDEFSLELLSYIFRSEDAGNFAVIFASRIEETKEDLIKKFFGFLRRDFMEIRLMPLGKEELKQLTVMVFGQSVPDFFIDFLFLKSGGNPYIAYELIESLTKSGDVYWNGDSWEFKKDFDFDVPSTLLALTEMKIASLGAKELNVLEYMAVFGKPVDLDLLSDFTGLRYEELIPIMDRLENLGFISRDFAGSYYVPEGVFVECLCEKLSENRRAIIHSRIADVLKEISPESVEEIAQHYYKGGNFDDAFEFLLKAAERAISYYALKNAITYYSWALGCLEKKRRVEEKDKRKAEILIKRSKLYSEVGDRKSAFVDAEEALNIALNAKDMELQAEASMQVGVSLLNLARYSEAIERLQHASSLFEKLRDFKGVVECDLHLGSIFQEQSKYKLSRSYYTRALETAKSINDEDLIMKAGYQLASLFVDMGNLDDAVPLLNEALTISKKLKDKKFELKISNQLGILYVEKGDLDKGIKLLQDSLELSRQLYDLRTEAVISHNLGIILFKHMGKTKEAVEYLERSLNVFYLIGDRVSECIVLSSLGTIYKSMGKYSAVKESFSKSLKIAKEIKAERLVLTASFNLANLYLDNGRLRSAFPKLQSSLRLARKLGLKDFEANILLSFGAYYYYIGDFKEAERYLKESAKVAKEIDQLNTFALVNIALMQVYIDSGDLRKASELAEQVEKVVQKLMNEVIQIDFHLLTLELDFLLGKPVGLKKVSTIIEKCKALGLQPRLADALVLAGRITARMEAMEKAREYFEKAIAILRKIGNAFYLARAYALYAEVLRYGGFKEESLSNYQKSHELFKNLNTYTWTKILSIPQPK